MAATPPETAAPAPAPAAPAPAPAPPPGPAAPPPPPLGPSTLGLTEDQLRGLLSGPTTNVPASVLGLFPSDVDNERMARLLYILGVQPPTTTPLNEARIYAEGVQRINVQNEGIRLEMLVAEAIARRNAQERLDREEATRRWLLSGPMIK